MNTKRWNVRGKSIDQIMNLVEKTIDELLAENEEILRIQMFDGGVSLDDADACVESRRSEKAEWRKETLAEMRRLFSGGEHLNS